MCQELPLLGWFFFCAKVSNENIDALCDCLEDRSASFIVLLNVAIDYILVSAASQQMTAGVSQGAEWARIGGSSPQSPSVWHLSNVGHSHGPQLAIAGLQHIAQE